MHDEVAELVFECVKKFSQGGSAVRLFHQFSDVLYPVKCLTDFDVFAWMIFKDIAQGESQSKDAQRAMLINGANTFYSEICNCYGRAIQSAHERFHSAVAHYREVVVPRRQEFPEAQDGINVAAVEKSVEALLHGAKRFKKRAQIDEAFIRSNWEAHFFDIHESLGHVSDSIEKLNASVEKVAKAAREDERLNIGRESLEKQGQSIGRQNFTIALALVTASIALTGFLGFQIGASSNTESEQIEP